MTCPVCKVNSVLSIADVIDMGAALKLRTKTLANFTKEEAVISVGDLRLLGGEVKITITFDNTPEAVKKREDAIEAEWEKSGFLQLLKSNCKGSV